MTAKKSPAEQHETVAANEGTGEGAEHKIKGMPTFMRMPSGSILWALLFVVAIGVWAITGEIKGGSQSTSLKNGQQEVTSSLSGREAAKGTVAPFKVRVALFRKQEFPATLIIRGRTFSDQQVDVKAETAGVVMKLPVDRGDFVKKGTLLCQLEDGARAANVLEAKGLQLQAKGDYEASKKLVKRGHTAGLRLLQNKAALDRATAALARAELDHKRTHITAPFDGFVETQPAKLGSFIAVGGACATLVALDPLRVVGAVRERDVKKIKPGDKGTAKLVTGETREGIIRFISATAENETRTFRMELEIPNPGGKLKSGVTADIEIPLEAKAATLLPPSILTLNDEGVVGVRAVNKNNNVEFWPVKIISERKEGIWVEALPNHGRVITVGQDYVKPGQKVAPVPDTKHDEKPGS